MVRMASALLMCGALLAGCSTKVLPPPEEEPARLAAEITASEALNTDAAGRSYPVVLRVYELRSEGLFMSADFFALYDADAATLGADLVARDELQVLPGQTLPLAKELDDATRFVGFLAGFRDLQGTSWRQVAPVKEGATLAVHVHLEESTLEIQD